MLTPEQIEKLDHRNTIELVSVPYLLAERTLFDATLERAYRHMHKSGTKVTITGNERSSSGWLEFGLGIEYSDGGRMFIGCIQRSADATPEFHS